jgi:hypothetical protein
MLLQQLLLLLQSFVEAEEQQLQAKHLSSSSHRLFGFQSSARHVSSSNKSLGSSVVVAEAPAAQAGMGFTASKRDTGQPPADGSGVATASATQHQPADAATIQEEHCAGAAGPSRLG